MNSNSNLSLSPKMVIRRDYYTCELGACGALLCSESFGQQNCGA